MRSTRRPSWSDRLLGLSPRPVPPFAFEVGEGVVRFGRFQESDEGVRFLEYRELELAANSFQSGVLGGPVRDPKYLAELLGKLVGSISVPVREAALILPDRWLRSSFVETGELPRSLESREEILRWKLKRLVPFRVEELRIRGTEIETLPRQEEPCRVMIGYALDKLLEQLEEAFAGHGIQIGYLTNRSLALLAGLGDAFPSDQISVLAQVRESNFTLTFARGTTPLLVRFKEQRGADVALEGNLVSRDLRLTRSFLEQHLPGQPLGRVLLAAPVEIGPEWLAWLSDGLGCKAEPLRPEHLALVGDVSQAPWWEAMAMIGATRLEVA